MDIKELAKKSKKELETVLKELRETLRQKKFQAAQGDLKTVREIRNLRKDIARILTRYNKHDHE